MDKEEAITFIRGKLEQTKMISTLPDKLRKKLIETVYETMAGCKHEINEGNVELYMLGIMDGMIYQLKRMLEVD